MTTRSDILDTAKSHVTKDRASTHGEAEDSFGLIGSLWGVYLNHPVSAYDVALMMALLKIARARMNPDHLDSVIDGAGYLACAGELASKNSAKPAETFGTASREDLIEIAFKNQQRRNMEPPKPPHTTIYDPS